MDACYQLVKSKKTWHEAVEHCNSLDPKVQSHLVNIHSGQENDFVWRLAPTTDFWIGYTNNWPDDKWNWAYLLASKNLFKKKSFGYYSNWARGQPDNHGGNQDCALMWGWYKTSKWDDRECNAKKWFVCKKGMEQYSAARLLLQHR